MFGDVVMDVDHGLFEDLLDDLKMAEGVYQDMSYADALKSLVESHKELVTEEAGKVFPQDPMEQLWGAVGAVFASWMNNRAITYRKLNDIPAAWGTAVNIQAMVFGNMGNDCATGVAFTRNPSTGENLFYGEFLVNAGRGCCGRYCAVAAYHQSTDRWRSRGQIAGREMPEVFSQLDEVRTRLEKHYGDMQDLEFTVEKHKLYAANAQW